MQIESTLAGLKVGPSHPPRIMGVINVSPESFYKKSIHTQDKSLATAVQTMEQDGAHCLDVGALSTAPYLKTDISEKEEATRLRKAFQRIRRITHLPLSVDTSRAQPALAALEAGADIINDVYGLTRDPAMPNLAKAAQGVILMANPKSDPRYPIKKPVETVSYFLKTALNVAKKHGISMKKIVLDPGIGFFRQGPIPWWQWDLEILRHLSELKRLKCPVLVGISRKSFIGHLLNGVTPENRLSGSLAATLLAVQRGASLIRTHDVGATSAALRISHALQFSQRNPEFPCENAVKSDSLREL